MAIIKPTEEIVAHGRVRIRWANLTEADSGEPYEFPKHTDKTVHIFGTFGAGGSVTLYGSNNSADRVLEPSAGSYKALQNVDGLSDITATATLLAQILENPSYIAPEVTAGTGVSVNVVIEAQRKQ